MHIYMCTYIITNIFIDFHCMPAITACSSLADAACSSLGDAAADSLGVFPTEEAGV